MTYERVTPREIKVGSLVVVRHPIDGPGSKIVRSVGTVIETASVQEALKRGWINKIGKRKTGTYLMVDVNGKIVTPHKSNVKLASR